MKIAAPTLLIALGVILVASLLSHDHWNVRTYEDQQIDLNRIAEAKQQ